MRGIGKRNVSLLMILMVAFMLLVGCGAKEEESEAKSLGQELFPDSTGLLDTLKMVQEGGGSSGNYAMSEGEANGGREETGAGAEEDGGNENAESESDDFGAGNDVVLDVGFVADITNTIKSPDDVYGEYVPIIDAYAKDHEVCINCMQGYEDDSTYEWYMSYSVENGTSYMNNVTGDTLEYLGIYDFGVDTEEISAILTAVDKNGQPHTMIGTYYWCGEDMNWKYWTEDGGVYAGRYTPMDGAFEDYSDGTVTVGGKTYKLGDDLTLIP